MTPQDDDLALSPLPAELMDAPVLPLAPEWPAEAAATPVAPPLPAEAPAPSAPAAQALTAYAAVEPPGAVLPVSPSPARVALGASLATARDATGVPLHAGFPLARGSVLGAGMQFEGHVQLSGELCVAGQFSGSVRALEGTGAPPHVLIQDSGRLRGEVVAPRITVLGRAEGVLDATSGQVALHGQAVVEGRVRYARLEVNGTELQAQFERVRTPGAAGPSGSRR